MDNLYIHVRNRPVTAYVVFGVRVTGHCFTVKQTRSCFDGGLVYPC
jgi:hypothetical protein